MSEYYLRVKGMFVHSALQEPFVDDEDGVKITPATVGYVDVCASYGAGKCAKL